MLKIILATFDLMSHKLNEISRLRRKIKDLLKNKVFWRKIKNWIKENPFF